jgi:hypothetical protein
MNSLAKYDAACRALAAASQVDEAKDIRDRAEAIRAYARQAGNLELEQQAMKIRLHAERRAGELLKEAAANGQRDGGKGGDRKSRSSATTVKPAKLKDLGITKDQSSKWQKMADIPAPDFEARINAVAASHGKVTTHSILHPDPPSPPRDPLNSVGFSIWDLLSTLHKAIRRGEERDALESAWRLDARTGPGFRRSSGGQLWSELRRITVEDIGEADPQAATDIYVLWKFWEKQTEADNGHEPWRLYTVRAVLRLCEAPKSRKVDHACILLSEKIDEIIAELGGTSEGKTWSIPAYAYDGIHTGLKNGKTRADFVIDEEAALSPKDFGIDDPYEAELRKKIAEVNAMSQNDATAAK